MGHPFPSQHDLCTAYGQVGSPGFSGSAESSRLSLWPDTVGLFEGIRRRKGFFPLLYWETINESRCVGNLSRWRREADRNFTFFLSTSRYMEYKRTAENGLPIKMSRRDKPCQRCPSLLQDGCVNFPPNFYSDKCTIPATSKKQFVSKKKAYLFKNL